jgi:hypothetical protein
MANVELSRRLAKVLNLMMLLGMEMPERMALTRRAERANDFSDLPEADRRAIMAAEKIAAANLTLGEIRALAREKKR